MRGLYAVLPPLSIFILGMTMLSITFVGALVALFGAADAFGRWKDYKYLSSFRYIPPRLVEFYGRSYCGRWMILSIDKEWRMYYNRLGYRWYHILPVGFPRLVLNPKFWRNLAVGHRR